MFILSSSSFILRFVNIFNIVTKVKVNVQKYKDVIHCMYYDKVSYLLYLYEPKNKICIPVFNNFKIKKAILVVRISILINLICKSVRIEWLSEPFIWIGMTYGKHLAKSGDIRI